MKPDFGAPDPATAHTKERERGFCAASSSSTGLANRPGKMLPRRILFSIVAACLPSALDAQMMKDWSLKNPMGLDTNLETNWELQGTTTPASDDSGMYMGVGVSGRVAYAFSKKPMPSTDFETSFSFTYGGGIEEPQKQGFALWYVHDAEMLKPLEEMMKDPELLKTGSFSYELGRKGYDLFGYKSRFDGVGVLFTTRTIGSSTLDTQFEEAVIAAVNDGTKTLYTNADVPSSLAQKIKFRNTPTDVRVTIRVSSRGVKVDVGNQTILDDKTPMRTGGYIGVSQYIEKHFDSHKKYDTLKITDFTTTNYDPSYQVRNTEAKKPEKKKDEHHDDLLYEHSTHKDHRDESLAIKELTNLVFKLVSETEPVQKQMEVAVDSLTNRVGNLEKILESLKSEINQRTGHDLDGEFKSIKEELMNLSTVASTQTQKRKDKMQELHNDLDQIKTRKMDKHLDQLTQTNQKVLETLKSGHNSSFWISCAAIGLILAGGLALYQRFRSWEKKHIL